ncbi:MAG: hypothetical protein GXP47_07885 [Acidobacteria bacterium]|nr:hypothetical protein [Acidobacteriota bacterium]
MMTRACRFVLALALAAGSLACTTVHKAEPTEAKSREDKYAEYVWPPPPDTPRIRLVDIIHSRLDVEPRSNFEKALIGSSPHSPWDFLKKPFGVALDGQNRILVTDPGTSALVRFDRAGRKMDVIGVKGAVRLKVPLGVSVGPDGTIYVADPGLTKVVAFSPEGKLLKVFGHQGELVNPTDAKVSPDGTRLYVTDSKAHKVVVFDLRTGEIVMSFGSRGTGPGQFNFPSALAFSPEGDLFVVDQMNSRVQVFTTDGEVLETFGALGVGFGNFVRPKDVAVNADGLVFVTDAAFGNVQIFDADLRLLTFVGENGSGPGQFQLPGGVAVHGPFFAVVDQLNKRVQLFRFIEPKSGE